MATRDQAGIDKLRVLVVLLVLVGLGAVYFSFAFTVSDEAVAQQINMLIGRLVTLHYDQKVGLLSSCFGDSRYYVTQVKVVEKIRLVSAVVVTVAPGSPAAN